MTVEDLIAALLQLPHDAEVWVALVSVEGPAESFADLGLEVYERGGCLRLVVSDGQAYHQSLDPHTVGLSEWLGARSSSYHQEVTRGQLERGQHAVGDASVLDGLV